MQEYRVSFPNRLSGATLAPPDEPLPPLRSRTATNPAAASPADPWQTDLGREILADREQIGALQSSLRYQAGDMAESLKANLDQWHNLAIEVSLAVATRLLHQQVTADAYPIEAMVREMARELADDLAVTVRLNPADAAMLERRLDGEPLLPGLGDPRLIADGTLARGECRLEGNHSLLLSNLGKQVQQIRDDLLRSLTHARS